jgi:hypothetical protein
MTRDDDALAARRRLMAQVHLGAARLFGAEDRDAYETYLEARTGKRSCKALTDRELASVARELRQAGALDSRERGGRGAERPTPAQWAKLAALARAMGWDGLESPALQGFVKRTAKVSNSRFLTRVQASRVITGLEKWLEQSVQCSVDSVQKKPPFDSAQGTSSLNTEH